LEIITIFLSGGVIQNVEIPDTIHDVAVEVRDYDICKSELEEDEYETDNDGYAYIIDMWYS
jgi:hypothetical protein